MDVMGQKHSYIPDDYYIIKNNIKSKTAYTKQKKKKWFQTVQKKTTTE